MFKEEAKVKLSPFWTSKEMKANVKVISSALEKNYTNTMIHLVQAGIESYLKDMSKKSTPYTEEEFPVPVIDTVKKDKPWSKQRFAKELQDLGADANHVGDWMVTRKTFTETAFNGTIKQIEKSGLTVAVAVEMCADNGWKGFKADYVNSNRSSTKNNSVDQTSKYDSISNQQGFLEHGN